MVASSMARPGAMMPSQLRQVSAMPTTGMSTDSRMMMLGQEIMDTPGFAESVAMEIWSYLPEEEQQRRQNARAYAEEMTSKILTEVWYFEQRHIPIFSALNAYHDQNIDFALLSRQWSDEEKAVFESQGLIDYVNPTLRRFAITALGEKMGRKTEWRPRARRPEHDAYATAAGVGMRWAAMRNKWSLQKAYVYRDGMAGSRGVAGCRLDPKNPFGGIVLERYRPHEFMWDVTTARDPRLKGTKYLERIYLDTRTSLMVEFPEWAEEIKNHTTPGMWGMHFATLEAIIKPRIDAPLGSNAPATVFQPLGSQMWQDSILRREFFRRHPVRKFRVVDGYRKKIVDFYSYDQAYAWAQATYQYWKNLMVSVGMDTEPAISDVQAVYVDVIDRVTLAGNIVLRVEQFGEEEFPYHFFIPEWIDGSITSFFGHGKDHQRIINRMFTRIDQAAGGVKGKPIVNRWALQGEYSQEELDAILASDTQPLYVNVPPGMSLDDVIKITGTPSIGELPSMLLKMAFEGQQQMFGGLNSVGDQQSSQESGKAVLARQSAASVAMIPYEAEFEEFDTMAGKAVLQSVQRLDHVTLMAIIDESTQDDTATTARDILSFGEQTLSEIDLDLEITEIAASPSARDRRLQQTSYLMQQLGQDGKFLLPAFMADADIDEDIRKKVEQQMQEQQQFDRDMQMREQAHAQYMETQRLDLEHLDRVLRMREIAIKEAPPPTIAGTIKLSDSPAAEAMLYNRVGIPADPLGVQQDKAIKALFDQQVRNMVQDEFNKRVPQWEKDHGKAAGAGGPKSPKDTNARASKGAENTG